MSTSRSTSRSNGTKEEEVPQQENNSSGGSFMAAATTLATIGAGAAVAFWGISKMLSNNKETVTQGRNRHLMEPSLVNPHDMVYESKNRSIWSPPSIGCYKMNTDGGCHPKRYVTPDGIEVGPSGYGGILRDHDGAWVQGFIGYIGEKDSFTAEVYGILKGLELLVQLNIKGAILEADHESLCNVHVNGEGKCEDNKSEIVRACAENIKKCRDLMVKNNITVEFVPRKCANECAHTLANIALEKKQEYLDIIDLPNELKYLVERDAKLYG
ncbi:putative ribonuclease H domain-containing protein [Helianthus annuus]|uniref:Ribonuclease H domain-containing protein n=1 Tax=Helianthus annuus TaxID=4232 RepID=A0A9K3E0J4_HELAN|nr:putative ribonuclease H domain-containing protein [Helianthus annuus]KAJ0455028.1 putative ribonuclease H domain-containing protein [Helianthus annuus]KAJ0830757.1 putative ribonuclease H domain-containing protein [Helianthus annuus]KAJ0844160.1 putative ribonuclease H domain-containing protein [Helianthus annuus]